MALARASLGLVSTIMLATSILFLFFIILPGVNGSTPFSKTYFLQADTSGISGAKDVTQWTFLYPCGANNQNCGKSSAAMPFGKAWASNAAEAPEKLIGKYGGHTTSFYYYYMWRFAWVFFIMALFFEICAFFTSFLACCGRLGAGISSLVTLLAFTFLTIAVSMMTATFVRARNVFHADGRSAKLGKYGFGFAWGSLAALMIAMVLLCAGTAKKSGSSRRKETNEDSAMATNNGNGTAKKSRWGRGRKNDHKAGSFSKVNYEDGRLDQVSV